MDNDRIDLRSVNKSKKQLKLPKLNNLFKKSAGPKRDQFGQFTSGSGGLLSLKKFNWSRVLPLLLIIALTGGYMVYRSFAGTAHDCYHVAGQDAFQVTEACINESQDAKVIRLYFGVLNRAPDSAGRKYWVDRLEGVTKPKLSLTEVARQFMGSAEFKNKYGSLSNQRFVEAMYPQVFGRTADAAGLKYWVDRLSNRTISREAMMVSFTESPEMKEAFGDQVAMELAALDYITSPLKTYTASEITCYGKKEVDPVTKKPACRVDLNTGNTSASLIAIGVNLPSSAQPVKGKYFVVCVPTEYKKTSGNGYVTMSPMLATKKITPSPENIYGYRNGGGFGESVGGVEDRRCVTVGDSPADMESVYLTFSSSNYVGSIWAGLDVKVYQRTTNRSSARLQVGSILQETPVNEAGAKPFATINLPSPLNNVPVLSAPKSNINYTALPANTQPAWVSKHDAYTGLNEVRVYAYGQNYGHMLYSGEKTKAEYIITDLSSNKRIPVDHYEAFYVDQQGEKRTQVISRDQVLAYVNNDTYYKYITPIFKLARPAKVKVEIKVYEGKIRLEGGVSVISQKVVKFGD